MLAAPSAEDDSHPGPCSAIHRADPTGAGPERPRPAPGRFDPVTCTVAADDLPVGTGVRRPRHTHATCRLHGARGAPPPPTDAPGDR